MSGSGAGRPRRSGSPADNQPAQAVNEQVGRAGSDRRYESAQVRGALTHSVHTGIAQAELLTSRPGGFHQRRCLATGAGSGTARERGRLPGLPGTCQRSRVRRCQMGGGQGGSTANEDGASVLFIADSTTLTRPANPGTHSHDGRRALIGMPCAARHPRAGQARSQCLTPAWVFGFGERGIRRAEEKELPAAADHGGSSRKVRDAWLGGRYRVSSRKSCGGVWPGFRAAVLFSWPPGCRR
jgi:hypothetical protein